MACGMKVLKNLVVLALRLPESSRVNCACRQCALSAVTLLALVKQHEIDVMYGGE